MNITGVLTEFEEALLRQAAMGGDDIAAAAELLVAALRPAGERLALELAEQAALEVGAQLPDASVEVRLREGEPELVVSTENAEPDLGDDMEARLTLRLPQELKSAIEAAAGDSGGSINSYVVRSLAKSARRATQGRRISGTFRT